MAASVARSPRQTTSVRRVNTHAWCRGRVGALAAVRDALANNYPTAAVERLEEVSRGDAVVAFGAEFDLTRRHPTKVTIDAAGLCVSERRG